MATDHNGDSAKRIARLSIGDEMTFWAETPGAPMHIALAGIVRLSPGATGGVDRIRHDLLTRSAQLPELAQHVVWTRFGEGPPALVDDPRDDPAAHIRVRPPAHLADDDIFARLAARLATQPLDHDRPLWRADLIPDTESGDVGVVLVIHHALADGMRGLAMAAVLFGLGADSSAPPLDDGAGTHVSDRELGRTARRDPTRTRLALDNLRRFGDLLKALRAAARAPSSDRRGWNDLRTSLRQLRQRAPRTRLDGPLTAGRHLTVVRHPLDQIREAGRVHGATVNDVLLTAVSSGLRDQLAALGDTEAGRSLRVSIPVASPPGACNAGGSMPIVTDLPLDPADPTVRLRLIHHDLASRKEQRDRSYGGVNESPFMPRSVMRALTHVMARQAGRLVNLYVTNVPGPTDPLWLGGGELVRPIPIAPLVAGCRTSVTALSYNGELVVAVHTDASLAHSDLLAAGIRRTFGQRTS